MREINILLSKAKYLFSVKINSNELKIKNSTQKALKA